MMKKKKSDFIELPKLKKKEKVKEEKFIKEDVKEDINIIKNLDEIIKKDNDYDKLLKKIDYENEEFMILFIKNYYINIKDKDLENKELIKEIEEIIYNLI